MVGAASPDDVIPAPAWRSNEPTASVITARPGQTATRHGDELLQHLPALRRFAYSLTGSQADAEDLVQAAIERALRAERQWRAGTRLDSWLFRIAQNLWRDHKRAARGRMVELDEVVELEGEDGRQVVAQRATLRALQRGLAELPLQQRAVLVLVVLQGASYEEAAAVLGVPKGTIMSRLARARVALLSKVAGERT
jgi:RNA polymerase sigma-70 factor (ECF subfamily)